MAWLSQEIGVLQSRRHVHNPKLLTRHPLSDKMVPDVDVLGVGRGDGVGSQVQSTHVVLADNSAPDAPIRKDKPPEIA